jgi:hypothetical protein
MINLFVGGCIKITGLTPRFSADVTPLRLNRFAETQQLYIAGFRGGLGVIAVHIGDIEMKIFSMLTFNTGPPSSHAQLFQ